jgi:polysaccharide biosynthesis transport protein
MLQINQRRADVDDEAVAHRIAQPEAALQKELLENLLNIVRRQIAPIAFITVLTTALSVLYLYVTPPTFKAEATMLIDSRKVQLYQQQQLFLDSPVDSAAIESQIQILKSDNVARAVIENLKLTENPEFGKPSGMAGLLASVVNFLHPSRPSSGADTIQVLVNAFQSRLDAYRIGGSFMVGVAFKSHDPERAAQIANATVDAYINYQMQDKFEAARRANVWLQDRIRELAEQSTVADRAVADFKAKHKIVSTGTGKLMSEEQLTDLNVRLLDARSQTSAAQARLDRVEAILAENGNLDDTKVGAAIVESLTNPIMTQLRTKYLDLMNREAELSIRVGSAHLAVVGIRRQIREIRNSIFDELQRIAETYKSDLVIAKQRQGAVEKALADAVSQSSKDNEAQSVLLDLESAARARHSLYSDFEQRYSQSTPSESLMSDARLISPASVPLNKNSPKTLLVLMIGILGGLVIGGGIGLLREMLDRVFRTGRQIEHALGTSCIALVPAVKTEVTSNLLSNLPEPTSYLPERPRNIVRKSNIIWRVSDSPFSRFAEAIRSLKLAVDLSRIDRPHRVLGFTSVIPNEGKTTIAASFALLVAQAGARVILVDGDLRNPSLSRTLTPNADCGIIEVISGKSSLEEVVWKDSPTDMGFLPAFVPSRLAHSSEILGSDRTVRLFERLRERYDYVVIDLSPLAPIVDVRATSRLVDAYVLVVEWGRTKIPVVERALSEAASVYENLLGVVLNKADMKAVHRYEGHFGAYYQNKHFSRYGYVD